MVACNKLILMEEGTTDTAAIGYSYTILEYPYAAFIADESIHSIVECRG